MLLFFSFAYQSCFKYVFNFERYDSLVETDIPQRRVPKNAVHEKKDSGHENFPQKCCGGHGIYSNCTA